MQESLHRNYVDIGITLIAVDDTKAWMLRAKSSDQFIKDCEDKFGKGRTVLYQCKSVARHLLPHIPADKLIEIGISKAQPLATFVKNSGKKPPAKLLAAAEDAGVGVEQFRARHRRDVAREARIREMVSTWGLFLYDGRTERTGTGLRFGRPNRPAYRRCF